MLADNSKRMGLMERLLELNKPSAEETVTVCRWTGEEESEFVCGPMHIGPRASDGDMVFTVCGISFMADDVVQIDDESQIVWLRPQDDDNPRTSEGT